jgi:hypothetical protein
VLITLITFTTTTILNTPPTTELFIILALCFPVILLGNLEEFKKSVKAKILICVVLLCLDILGVLKCGGYELGELTLIASAVNVKSSSLSELDSKQTYSTKGGLEIPGILFHFNDNFINDTELMSEYDKALEGNQNSIKFVVSFIEKDLGNVQSIMKHGFFLTDD